MEIDRSTAFIIGGIFTAIMLLALTLAYYRSQLEKSSHDETYPWMENSEAKQE